MNLYRYDETDDPTLDLTPYLVGEKPCESHRRPACDHCRDTVEVEVDALFAEGDDGR